MKCRGNVFFYRLSFKGVKPETSKITEFFFGKNRFFSLRAVKIVHFSNKATSLPRYENLKCLASK